MIVKKNIILTALSYFIKGTYPINMTIRGKNINDIKSYDALTLTLVVDNLLQVLWYRGKKVPCIVIPKGTKVDYITPVKNWEGIYSFNNGDIVVRMSIDARETSIK